MVSPDDAVIIEDGAEWRRGMWAAVAAIEAARRNGDWAPLDLLGMALGIGNDPADRGAWEAVCEALVKGSR